MSTTFDIRRFIQLTIIVDLLLHDVSDSQRVSNDKLEETLSIMSNHDKKSVTDNIRFAKCTLDFEDIGLQE
jgi:hypothetical protein